MSEPKCLDGRSGESPCEGYVTERRSAGGTCTIHRCGKHWDKRDELEERLRRDYPDSPIAPDWFDPTYAGETWDEDY